MAYHDAYFEGALNNASGMAVVMALAEYFMQVDPRQRCRTIRLVASQGHHSGSFGTQWMAEHKDTFLAKTVLIINAEHVAVAQSGGEERLCGAPISHPRCAGGYSAATAWRRRC